MRFARCVILLFLGTSCATANRPAPTPTFTQGTWRIRLDVDSTPGRRPPSHPIFGTINFATGHYAIDLFQALSRRDIRDTARIAALPRTDERQPATYRIILGDSASYDDKLVFIARQVTRDSLVGTWSETIVCCSAAGRFSLSRGGQGPFLGVR
jgi:hypothetical protein